MKKLENALQKIDKYGQFVMKKLVNRRSLAELQGIGQGKTVLITGASSGIGAMMARRASAAVAGATRPSARAVRSRGRPR